MRGSLPCLSSNSSFNACNLRVSFPLDNLPSFSLSIMLKYSVITGSSVSKSLLLSGNEKTLRLGSGKNTMRFLPSFLGVGSCRLPFFFFHTWWHSASINTPGHSYNAQPSRQEPPALEMTLSRLLKQSPAWSPRMGFTSSLTGSTGDMLLQKATTCSASVFGFFILSVNVEAMHRWAQRNLLSYADWFTFFIFKVFDCSEGRNQ